MMVMPTLEKTTLLHKFGCDMFATTMTLKTRGTKMSFTAIYQKVPEGYIAFVEELPGANTQGHTLEEARENLKDAIRLVLKCYP